MQEGRLLLLLLLLCGGGLDHGGWSFCRVPADKSSFFFSLCSEPELGLKSVWLFVFIALTNLFI